MKVAQIRGIAGYLPEGRLDNGELAQVFSNWTEEKIRRKLGIATRPIAAEGETAVDLGVKAGERLFASGIVRPDEIDFIVFCTQSPDYFLPSSACVIQRRLNLPTRCGAFDINLGCSGFVYCAGVCKGLIESGLARNVLLITSETYSKYINKEDRTTRPLFGDGAAAILFELAPESDSPDPSSPNPNSLNAGSPNPFAPTSNDVFSGAPTIGPFEFGTNGEGAKMLIVPAGARRKPSTPKTAIPYADSSGGFRSDNQLYMHGPGIFAFSIETIPPLVKRFEDAAAARGLEIDAYIFHQANKFMLDRLRELCEIDPAKYFNDVLTRGNTVSSSIPIAIIDSVRDGLVKPGSVALLVGFGVGLSWAAAFVRFPKNFEVVPLD